jgi:SAM-dependent methyltransferase
MQKLHQSTVLNNLDQFKLGAADCELMRDDLEMLLYWKIVKYTRPNSILEIGTYAGQTLGLMIEASGSIDGTYTSVDINVSRLSAFKTLFKNLNVEYLNIDSKELNLNRKYDVIHIDGDHSYEYAANDIEKVSSCLHNNSILIIDDYQLPGVDQAIDELLSGELQFIPFMQGHQATFFHHQYQDLNYFLDNYICSNGINEFIEFRNVNYKGHTVLKVDMPVIFAKHHHLFLQALKLYDV